MEVFDRATAPDNEEITVDYLETFTYLHGGATAVVAFLTILTYQWSPRGLLGPTSILLAAAGAAVTGMLVVKTSAQTMLFKDIYLMDRGAQARQQMQQNGSDR